MNISINNLHLWAYKVSQGKDEGLFLRAVHFIQLVYKKYTKNKKTIIIQLLLYNYWEEISK